MDKIYQLYGIDTAMHLLRPGAKWEISNTTFTRWEDPRPCPTMEEVLETMEKIKAFEDSINTLTALFLVGFTHKQIEIQTEFIFTKMVTSASRFQQKTGTIGIVRVGGMKQALVI